MGSPMVFQTAPPQPASKARMTCSPQFVGGADASQKGLRHGMPQKVVSNVGLDGDMLRLQPCSDADPCALSVCNCVHHLASAVGAVPACEKLRVGSLSRCSINHNPATFHLDISKLTRILREKT